MKKKKKNKYKSVKKNINNGNIDKITKFIAFNKTLFINRCNVKAIPMMITMLVILITIILLIVIPDKTLTGFSDFHNVIKGYFVKIIIVFTSLSIISVVNIDIDW